MIELRNLTIGYEQKGNRKVVAEHLNATLREGQLTCLIGANGIGKSTLLRTLAAFQPPLSGEIFITPSSDHPLSGESSASDYPFSSESSASDHSLSGESSASDHPFSGEVSASAHPPLGGLGASLSSLSQPEIARLIGIVLTEKPDVQNLNVFELVGMGRSPYTGFWGTLKDYDREVVMESLRLVGIEDLKDRLIQTLSDGERQKMMIAKALAQQTPVIYLDEPTAFLDYPSKAEILQLLKRLAHDTRKTIFLSTHDLELALQIADELWLLDADELCLLDADELCLLDADELDNTSALPSGAGRPRRPVGSASLTIGTPAELAASGAIGRFLDRPGMRFDPETLTIKITNC